MNHYVTKNNSMQTWPLVQSDGCMSVTGDGQGRLYFAGSGDNFKSALLYAFSTEGKFLFSFGEGLFLTNGQVPIAQIRWDRGLLYVSDAIHFMMRIFKCT